MSDNICGVICKRPCSELGWIPPPGITAKYVDCGECKKTFVLTEYYECSDGHILCCKCILSDTALGLKRRKLCPECRSPLMLIDGLEIASAGNVAIKFFLCQTNLLNCRYRNVGCMFRTTGFHMIKHLEVCEFRPVSCKLEGCRGNGLLIGYGEYKNHLLTKHVEDPGVLPVINPTDTVKRIPYAKVHEGLSEMFILKAWEDSYKNLYFYLVHFGRCQDTRMYAYKLKIGDLGRNGENEPIPRTIGIKVQWIHHFRQIEDVEEDDPFQLSIRLAREACLPSARMDCNVEGNVGHPWPTYYHNLELIRSSMYDYIVKHPQVPVDAVMNMLSRRDKPYDPPVFTDFSDPSYSFAKRFQWYWDSKTYHLGHCYYAHNGPTHGRLGLTSGIPNPANSF